MFVGGQECYVQVVLLVFLVVGCLVALGMGDGAVGRGTIDSKDGAFFAASYKVAIEACFVLIMDGPTTVAGVAAKTVVARVEDGKVEALSDGETPKHVITHIGQQRTARVVKTPVGGRYLIGRFVPVQIRVDINLYWLVACCTRCVQIRTIHCGKGSGTTTQLLSVLVQRVGTRIIDTILRNILHIKVILIVNGETLRVLIMMTTDVVKASGDSAIDRSIEIGKLPERFFGVLIGKELQGKAEFVTVGTRVRRQNRPVQRRRQGFIRWDLYCRYHWRCPCRALGLLATLVDANFHSGWCRCRFGIKHTPFDHDREPR
mmetsp:Transcript_1498/g.2590  ORF Transcript_1498/g.2590 Transcript_1498/m.2590 type:complete len:317 (-) Transcript_1498:95-1045(-)